LPTRYWPLKQSMRTRITHCTPAISSNSVSFNRLQKELNHVYQESTHYHRNLRFHWSQENLMNKLLVLVAAIAAAYVSPGIAGGQANAVEPAVQVEALSQQSDVIARAERAFAAQLAVGSSPAAADSAHSSWIAEEAVYEYSLGRPFVALKLEGRAAIVEHLLASVTQDADFTNVRFFPTPDPNIVFVQYEVTARDAATGEQRTRRAIAQIDMKGEQIAKLREFSKSQDVLGALVGAKSAAVEAGKLKQLSSPIVSAANAAVTQSNPLHPAYFAARFTNGSTTTEGAAVAPYVDANNPLTPIYSKTSDQGWIATGISRNTKPYIDSGNPLNPLFIKRF